MNFQTRVPVEKQKPAITYHSETVLLGSCFVEHIGEKLEFYYFKNLVNPFGIIFNPYSIAGIVERAVNQHWFTDDDFFFSNGRWHAYELHSNCSLADRGQAVTEANQKLSALHNTLSKASHVLVTLGTAWVYKLAETGQVVANCHKQPQRLFEKTLLDTEAIGLQLQKIDHLIKRINPDCSFVVTVSPVRHLRDGLVESQRSKAHLITALHDFIGQTSRWNYFPSYEILMDELRDYRFYADDMLHPSAIAVNVVWQRFSGAWIASEALPVMDRVEQVRKALKHKPFDPEGEAHQRFLERLEKDMSALRKEYPQMTFTLRS